ncbi:MAG: MCE family protein [Ideonella sp.]|nr:MCE family protein [Ideonella sp.]
MKRQANPLRVGLFALVGLAVLAAGLVVVGGGMLFASRAEQAVLYFKGSIYGLRVGAPVVFRGVRIGNVSSIDVEPDARSPGGFNVPVVVRIDSAQFGAAQGPRNAEAPSLKALVQQGLRAQLQTQSLLTGQLYVELDMDGQARVPSALAGSTFLGLPEIPAAAAPLSIQTQLQALNLQQLVKDVSGAAAAARQLLGGPEARHTLEDLARLSASLARISATLDQRLGPLADGVQATVRETRSAVASLGAAAERTGSAVDRVGAAAGRVDALLAPDSALLGSLKQASDELGRSAATLRQALGEDSALMQNTEGAMQELRRSARSVRNLVDVLERNPEALLRGRPASP